MPVSWKCKPFDELKPSELYDILRLRNEVFVVEQNCVYQDVDNKDLYALHLMGWSGEQLVAYTRLLPKDNSHPYVSIGRVVTSPNVRGTGLGKELMRKSVDTIYNIWGRQPVRVSAQLYLRTFYESLGFQQTSDIYLEDGIEHIEMILKE